MESVYFGDGTKLEKPAVEAAYNCLLSFKQAQEYGNKQKVYKRWYQVQTTHKDVWDAAERSMRKEDKGGYFHLAAVVSEVESALNIA